MLHVRNNPTGSTTIEWLATEHKTKANIHTQNITQY